jgi:hypothetical protein
MKSRQKRGKRRKRESTCDKGEGEEGRWRGRKGKKRVISGVSSTSETLSSPLPSSALSPLF